MFERITDKDERGQVGIGTLIVFIAMVLVAAIAAGVLINTAGFLQSKGEETGQQSSQQVTNRVGVVSVTGTGTDTDADSGDGNDVSTVEILVSKSPGSDDIDLSEVTIQWIGPQGEAVLTQGSGFSVENVKGVSNSVLDDNSDRAKLSISLNTDNTAPAAIETGESVTMTVTTASGGTARVDITVPESLSSGSAVEL